MKVLTSREFNQDVSKAKRFAALEPVFVTDRGRTTHVLLGIEAYRHLCGHFENLVDRLAAPRPIDIEPDWRATSPFARRGTS